MLKGEGKNAGGQLRGGKADIREEANSQEMDEKGMEGEEVKRSPSLLGPHSEQ